MPLSRINAFRFGFALIATAFLLLSCDSKPGNPEAVPLPESLAEPVELAGTRFQALAYMNRQQSEAAFGLNIRGIGLLPLRISIDNRGGAALKIIPRQTFLIDLEGQAWPLLTSDQAFSRLERAGIKNQNVPKLPALDDLESLTGFALDVTTSAGFSANAYTQSETRIGKKLHEKNLRNPKVAAGKVASGVLFFPGWEEAESARSLRLCFEQDGRLKFLTLPLKPTPPDTPAP
jgi:hypothetical protein